MNDFFSLPLFLDFHMEGCMVWEAGGRVELDPGMDNFVSCHCQPRYGLNGMGCRVTLHNAAISSVFAPP